MQILFNCQLAVDLNQIKNCKIVSVNYTDDFELELVLEIDPKINEELDFAEFTEYFGIPYHLVNCEEAYNFCAV